MEHYEDEIEASAVAAGAGAALQGHSEVQLGFCIAIDDEDHLMEVAHRSFDCEVWDGGQVGGKPVWLNPQHLPTRVICKECQSQQSATDSNSQSQKHSPPNMRFVCQIYAPVEFPNSDRAYHRTLYVFACPTCCGASSVSKNNNNNSNHHGGIRVLRAQLPEQNPYYPSTSTDTGSEVIEVNWQHHLPPSWNHNLCAVCGFLAKGKCPVQQQYFCGPHHQREYKSFIFNDNSSSNNDKVDATVTLETNAANFLPSVYPMTQLVVEVEPASPRSGGQQVSSSGHGHPNTMFKSNLSEANDQDEDELDDDADLEQDDLNKMTGAKSGSVSQDPISMAFYNRIQDRPDVRNQCLRYCRWNPAEPPLWLQQKGRPEADDKDIPPCPFCNSPRKYEFQLMPQMLHYLFQGRNSHRRSKRAHNNSRDQAISDYSNLKEALKQTDSIVHQAPPAFIPPALIDARDAAVKRVQEDLLHDNNDAQTFDEINWGIVAVYTCTNSCCASSNDLNSPSAMIDSELGAYREEFAWVQPSLDLV